LFGKQEVARCGGERLCDRHYRRPAPAPVVTAPQQQPVIYDTAPAPQVIAVATPTTPGGGGKYTVQKGDTLWKISTSQYGDGKQWQRIVAANPGLSPATLKAGQTITIP